MGNSSGNLQHYWAVVAQGGPAQGGFLWDWADQGLEMAGPLRGAAAGRAGGARPARAGSVAWGYGGDFGETGHDAQFCLNGLVWPDRTPHPACHEVKHAQRPVACELGGWSWALRPGGPDGGAEGPSLLGEGRVLLRSALDHSNLGDLCEVSYSLLVRGRRVFEAAAAPLDLPARASRPLAVACALPLGALPLALLALLGEAAPGPPPLLLELNFFLREDAPWAAAGHEMAFAQLALPLGQLRALLAHAPLAAQPAAPHPASPTPAAPPSPPAGARPPVAVSAGRGGLLLLTTARGSFGFDRASGALCSVVGPDGAERLAEGGGLHFSFWRAPTDNDHGGVEFMRRWVGVLPREIGLGVQLLPRLPFWLTQAVDWLGGRWGLAPIGPNVSYDTIWRAESWHDLEPTRKADARVEHAADGSVTVRAQADMLDPRSGALRARCELATHVCPSGHAWVCARADVRTPLPSIPRVGLRLRVREAFGRACSWLGRGPHENYDDRCEGARVGVHRLPASEMHVGYIVPSENGLRTGLQWLALHDQVSGRDAARPPRGRRGRARSPPPRARRLRRCLPCARRGAACCSAPPPR